MITHHIKKHRQHRHLQQSFEPLQWCQDPRYPRTFNVLKILLKEAQSNVNRFTSLSVSGVIHVVVACTV